MRNRRALLTVLILPALVQAVAMGFSLIKPPLELELPLKLTGDLYPGFQFLRLLYKNTLTKKQLLILLLLFIFTNKFQDDTSKC